MRPRVLSGIRPRFQGLSQSAGQITHVLLTRSPLIHTRRCFSVRLACVKHAASVRPEPGSNSPTMSEKKSSPIKPTRHTPDQTVQSASKKQTYRSQNHRHAVEFSKNTPTPDPPENPGLTGGVISPSCDVSNSSRSVPGRFQGGHLAVTRAPVGWSVDLLEFSTAAFRRAPARCSGSWRP